MGLRYLSIPYGVASRLKNCRIGPLLTRQHAVVFDVTGVEGMCGLIVAYGSSRRKKGTIQEFLEPGNRIGEKKLCLSISYKNDIVCVDLADFPYRKYTPDDFTSPERYDFPMDGYYMIDDEGSYRGLYVEWPEETKGDEKCR